MLVHGPWKQPLIRVIMVAEITLRLHESQRERQLEAVRQSRRHRHSVLRMSFCQTESLGRFVFDNSIKASFSLWRFLCLLAL